MPELVTGEGPIKCRVFESSENRFPRRARVQREAVTVSDGTPTVLETTEDIASTGAVGITFGRNVWQHDDPKAMIAAPSDIVNDGATAEGVKKHFE